MREAILPGLIDDQAPTGEDWLKTWVDDEASRCRAFPVAGRQVFMAHAGVTVLPRVVSDAVVHYTEQCSRQHQEFGGVLKDVEATRSAAARLLGGSSHEYALIGPTSLGLSLVANGLSWKQGDEIICYRDDYPANVYPWMNLEKRGVVVRYIDPPEFGRITPESVFAVLTAQTKLVALASCHFLSGWLLDVETIGVELRKRGILFCLDAIQTIGAMPTSVEYVDFLSADAHKWMLGPLTAGVFFVRKERFAELQPTLIGAWNGIAPDFVTQDTLRFPESGQRYEPGVLNVAGIYGMAAAWKMFEKIGIPQVTDRIQQLRSYLREGLVERGFICAGPSNTADSSGILACQTNIRSMGEIFRLLEEAGIIASHRKDRSGQEWVRFSPHFYNTQAEVDRIFEVLDQVLLQ